MESRIYVQATSRGFTILEVTLATAVLSIALMTLTFFVDFVSISSAQSKQKDNISNFRQQLISTIQDKTAWYQTVSKSTTSDNENLYCLTNDTCTSSSGGAFKVRNRDGTVFYDQIMSSNTGGFGNNGIPCSGFDGSHENNQCPFRYELSWSASCPLVGPCINPGVKISGNFVQSADSKILKNAEDLKFEIYLNSEPKELPLAIQDEFYFMRGEGPINLQILSNDYFLMGNDALTISNLSTTHSGTPISINVDQKSVSYAQTTSFYGLDYFEYTVTSAVGGTSTGKVWVRVMTPFTWTGDGGDQEWHNSKNWCGTVKLDRSGCTGSSSVPHSSDFVVFDDTVKKGKEFARIGQAAFASGIHLSHLGKIGFKGALTQGNNIVLRNDGYKQESGTFAYEAGNTLEIIGFTKGDFEILGGEFTAPPFIDLKSSKLTISDSSLFNHNNGTIRTLNHGGNANPYVVSLNTGSSILNNFTSTGPNHSISVTGTTKITGSLILDQANKTNRQTIDNGTLEVSGDVSIVSWGNGGQTGGTGTIKLVGNNQTFTAVNPGQCTPKIEVASPGNVAFVGDICLGEDFKYTSGTVDASASTFTVLSHGGGGGPYSIDIDSGAMSFQNVNLGGGDPDANFDITVIGEMKIAGDLTLNQPKKSNHQQISGSIGLFGNLNVLAWGDGGGGGSYSGGTGSVTLLGNSNATVNQQAGHQLPRGLFQINKGPTATVTLNSPLLLMGSGQDLLINSGHLKLSGHNLSVADQITCEAGTSITKSGGAISSLGITGCGGS